MLNQLFMYEGSQVRTVIVENEPWFVLKDLCDVLEIGHAPALKQRLSDDVVSNYPMPDSLGRIQDTAIVNEDGMYDVVLESRKAKARAFRKWVTGDVLPSIRKHGAYMTAETIEKTLSDPDFIIGLATELKTERAKRALLEAQLEATKPLTAFAESLQVATNSILIGELAKLLKQNGINIGRDRLFETLRREGYLMRHGSQYNAPTQRSMDLKLMEVKVGIRASTSDGTKATQTTKITGKGIMYFINKFKDVAVSA